ncbi:protein phosphatase 2A regulatory B subunit [Hesseltinella vesiculosa]|uniref:Serine/threonine-protein phosphatase 2A 56 kDa regulatory subunit n=1 Tax=Hesseltinella vesiculosa TaxID=101127 RepID=A0A1X2GIP3_9FUNG|nr:protein phosphatase 2A regulatory B subunit [Hesseltinella vesiculosa]
MMKGIKDVLTRRSSSDNSGEIKFGKPKNKTKALDTPSIQLHPTESPPPVDDKRSEKSKKRKKTEAILPNDQAQKLPTSPPPNTTAIKSTVTSSSIAKTIRQELIMKPNAMSKLKASITPKDTVLPVGKSPRRRKSSRFHIHDQLQQDLERYPHFKGKSENKGRRRKTFFLEVPVSQRQELFSRKLAQCTVLFDFTEPTAHIKSKEIKRQALQELTEYVAVTKNAVPDILYPKVIRMVSVNLFRTIPPPLNPLEEEELDEDEEDPVLESAWPHLQLVYEFFLRFVESPDFNVQLAKKYIDEQFILQVLDLFDSEDPRERDLLKTTLHRLYGKFLGHRAFIRKSINHIFYQYIYETDRFNGIAELLEILGRQGRKLHTCIINGFALPLKQEHKTFLFKALVPLHKPSGIASYYPQLVYCVVQFLEKDSGLTKEVVSQLLRLWPKTNSAKEVMFLNEMEEIIDITDSPTFSQMMAPFCQRLASSIGSTHFQVAERALLFWNNDYFLNLLHDHIQELLPILYPVLYENAKIHWNRTIHTLIYNALKLTMDMNGQLFDQCSKNYQLELQNREKHKSDRDRIWKKLEDMALDEKQPKN